MIEGGSTGMDAGGDDQDASAREPGATATAMVRASPTYITTLASRVHEVREHALPDPSDPRLLALTEPASPRAEAFRVLRDGLVAKGLPRVLAVTSPHRGDGKTTCAVGLAAALAERPMTNVLLLDGDLTAPTFGPLFGVDDLTPTATWSDAPWLTAYRVVEVAEGLCVGAIVRAPGQPRPCLDPRFFQLVLSHLSGSAFEHVIVDLPAIERTPAVARIAGTADATLLAARAGRTTTRALRDAVAEVGAGRMVGVALLDGWR